MSKDHPTFPEHPSGELAERLRNIRYVITDADGTMLTGARATVNTAGKPSAELVETLVELQLAGVSVIPCTGRNRAMIQEDARVLGLPGWIAEMGGILCTRQSSQPEWHYFCGSMPYDESCGKTPHDLICENGVIDAMLKRWAGSLETYHDTGVGFEYREVSVALRGAIDEVEAQNMLDASGLALYLSDNGMVGHISGATNLKCNLEHPEGVHTLRLMRCSEQVTRRPTVSSPMPWGRSCSCATVCLIHVPLRSSPRVPMSSPQPSPPPMAGLPPCAAYSQRKSSDRGAKRLTPLGPPLPHACVD